jgi:hypothetical protein
MIPQPIDISNIPLQGTLNNIPTIQNFNTISGTWYSVVLEAEESKQILIQVRDKIDWFYATTSGGNYFTFRVGSTMQAPIVAISGTIIGWVSADSPTTFEVLVGR